MEHIKDILCPDCNENEINEERFNTYGKCTGVLWTGGIDQTYNHGVSVNGNKVQDMSAYHGTH